MVSISALTEPYPPDPLAQSPWRHVVPFFATGKHMPLLHEVQSLRTQCTIYPAQNDIFRALAVTPPQDVRVVIVGQDPYHGAGQAHGLAFSVPEHTRPLPPSLKNIFKEIQDDIYGGAAPPMNPDLHRWARQGVLLLNTVLTVEAGKAHSHAHLSPPHMPSCGWHACTHAILEAVAQGTRPVAVLLWGKPAQSLAPIFTTKRGHCVLMAAHPSPLSAHRGFLGCKHFSQVNAWLENCDDSGIMW